MTFKDHTHGVVAPDCSHPDCKAAVARCQKRSKLRRLEGASAYVDATPARLHIATLTGACWSMRSIAGAAGVSIKTIAAIADGQASTTPETIRGILSVDPFHVPTTSPGQTEPFVSKIGTVRRLQALMALGWPHTEIQRRSGVRSAVLISQAGRWVTLTTHQRVTDLYRQLCTQPGPSSRAANEARKRGYLGPLAWDDIDHDPAPDLDNEQDVDPGYDENVVLRVLAGENLPATTAERREIVRRWPTTGRPMRDLADLTGWKPERYSRRDEEAA